MRKVVFFDVDGVLLEWFKPFITYANFKGIPLRFEDITGYNLEFLHHWPRPEECFKMIGDFAKTHAWANLPLLCNPKSLNVLKNMGYELRVLSQVSSASAQRTRTIYLSEVYGPVFSGIHYTTHKTSKLQHVIDFRAGNKDVERIWFLDDKPSAIKEFYLYKGYSGLITPVGINNVNDHPYLTEDMTNVQSMYGCSVMADVNEFVAHALIREYPYGR